MGLFLKNKKRKKPFFYTYGENELCTALERRRPTAKWLDLHEYLFCTIFDEKRGKDSRLGRRI